MAIMLVILVILVILVLLVSILYTLCLLGEMFRRAVDDGKINLFMFVALWLLVSSNLYLVYVIAQGE